MTSLKVGDLVELHPGTGRLGTVLDVVESRPRWLLVYWHTPPNIGINPLLENEEFLELAVGDASRAMDVDAPPATLDNDECAKRSIQPMCSRSNTSIRRVVRR